MMNRDAGKEVSVLVKTFNREKALVKLLHSLNNLQFPGPVLVADDSALPYAAKMPDRFPSLDLHCYTMPFDSGLSAGRNLLLQKVKTPYLLLCDDDFVFDMRLDLTDVITRIRVHELDIAGGTLYNYITASGPNGLAGVFSHPVKAFRYIFNVPAVARYAGHFSRQDGACELHISNRDPGLAVYACDVINNFFLAKTQSLLEINGWDESFKVGEHEDFFYRAKIAGLRVALVNGFVARHYPGARKAYLRFRERSFELKKQFPAKYGFSSYREIDRDTNKLLFTWSPEIGQEAKPAIKTAPC